MLSDAVIAAMAADPRADIGKVKGIGRYGRGPGASAVRRAVREGLRAEPVRRPRAPRNGGPRLSPRERARARERLRLLKDWRSKQAKQLGLDPPLVWPAVSLGRLAARPDSLPSELECEDVRRWQRREFAESLAALASGGLEGASRPGVDGKAPGPAARMVEH